MFRAREKEYLETQKQAALDSAHRNLQSNPYAEIDYCVELLKQTKTGTTPQAITVGVGISSVLLFVSSFFISQREKVLASSVALAGLSGYCYSQEDKSIGALVRPVALARLNYVARQLGSELRENLMLPDAIEFFNNLRRNQLVMSLKHRCEEYKAHLKGDVENGLNVEEKKAFNENRSISPRVGTNGVTLLIMKANYINMLLQHLNNRSSEVGLAGFLREVGNEELQKCITLNRSSFRFRLEEQTAGKLFLSDIDRIITQANLQVGRDNTYKLTI